MLITQREAAAMLRVSVKTIERMRKAGALPYIPGRPVRLRRLDVEQAIEKGIVCHARTEDRSSMSADPVSTRSGLRLQEDREAALRARAIFNSLRKS